MPSLSPLSSLDSTYNANVSRNCEEAELGTWRAQPNLFWREMKITLQCMLKLNTIKYPRDT